MLVEGWMMKQARPLGGSGIETLPLMLGGNVFGWTADEATSFAILDRFVEAGGTLIDTADVYSVWQPGAKGGESETVLGAWMKARGNRDAVQIATKVGFLPIDEVSGLSAGHIARAIDNSLQRLGTDYVDLYFAHTDDDKVPLEETLGAFDALVKAGKVRAIGASNFKADRLAEALAVSDANGFARYTVLEPEYNLVSRDDYDSALQDLCAAENVGVVPYFGLASGFLTGKYRSAADVGAGSRGAKAIKFLEGKGAQVLAAMDEIAAETGATLPAIALAWLAEQPGITAPIASATSVAQLDGVLASLALDLSPEQLDRLTQAGR
jgi:aryl-alcohol dehydrogenase-like predicted oxidoreductase